MSNKGLWYAVGAYITWGLFPIYWKWLHHVPASQLIGHRIAWSFVMLFIFILISKQWNAFRATWNPKVIGTYALAAILIGVNWYIYVWAVNSNFIVETSLGYFINPLFSVLLGVVILREKLRSLQWVPVGLAAIGVGYLTYLYGRPPYIALALAFTFGCYGLVKKLAPLNSVFGLTLETGILFIPAFAYLLFVETNGTASFLHGTTVSDILMVGAGLVTTVPLLMFASAAQRIPLTMVGIMQYIAPTLQFLLGVLIYKEPFSSHQFIGFSFVWLALIIFATENYSHNRKSALRQAV